MTTPTDHEKSILDTMRHVLLPKPHEETLRKLESDLAMVLAPLVQATYEPDGTVTVRVSESKHSAFSAKIGVIATTSHVLADQKPAKSGEPSQVEESGVQRRVMQWEAINQLAHERGLQGSDGETLVDIIRNAIADLGEHRLQIQRLGDRLNLPPPAARWEDPKTVADAVIVGLDNVDYQQLIRRAENAEAQVSALLQGKTQDNLTKPPPGFNVSRLPQSLQKSIDTANAWGPNAIMWAWSIELEDRARRNLGWPEFYSRTDFEIIEQTNELARKILQIEGHTVHQEYLFWAADTARAKRAWEMARQAQLALTATDPNDALSNVGWATECDDHSKPPPGFDPNRLPESLQKTIRTNGVWRAEALSEAWFLVYQDRAKRHLGLLAGRTPKERPE